MLVLGRERYKGGSRVRFVCGHRALDACRERNTVLDDLSRTLSASIEALPEAASRTVDRLAESDKRVRDLTERALEGEARRLLAEATSSPAASPTDRRRRSTTAGPSPICARSLCTSFACPRAWPSWGAGATRRTSSSPRPKGSGTTSPRSCGPRSQHVEGRGGGKGNLAQGAGERLDRLDEALRRTVAALQPNG